MTRAGGRAATAIRPVKITAPYLQHPEGSALIMLGRTWVVCTATVEDRVPGFRLNTGQGWLTAEYDMLPRATATRSPRAATTGRASGRSREIQRLIGRSLRGVVDLTALGERTIVLDCDVLQADGGTRTAAITGAFVALCQALADLQRQELIETVPLTDQVVAVSVGQVRGQVLVDLDYEEDSQAEVDANLVLTGRGQLVELQATGEGGPFDPELLSRMVEASRDARQELCRRQEEIVGRWMALPW